MTSARAPGQGKFSVADPRTGEWFGGAYGVGPWDKPANTVTGRGNPSCGVRAVADPRATSDWFKNTYRVVPWDAPSGTVTGQGRPSNGAPIVADPRGRRFNNVYRVVRWDEPSVAVNGGGGPSSGAAAVADPRLGCQPRSGTLGVTPWDAPAPTVTASQDVHAGASAVADRCAPFKRHVFFQRATAHHHVLTAYWKNSTGTTVARWSAARLAPSALQAEAPTSPGASIVLPVRGGVAGNSAARLPPAGCSLASEYGCGGVVYLAQVPLHPTDAPPRWRWGWRGKAWPIEDLLP